MDAYEKRLHDERQAAYEKETAAFNHAQTVTERDRETANPIMLENVEPVTELEKDILTAMLKVREAIGYRNEGMDNKAVIFDGVEQYPNDNMTIWETFTLVPPGIDHKYILGLLRDETITPPHDHLLIGCCTTEILEYHDDIRRLLERCLGQKIIMRGGGYYTIEEGAHGGSQMYGKCDYPQIITDTLGRLTETQWQEKEEQAKAFTGEIVKRIAQMTPEERNAEIIKRLTPFVEFFDSHGFITPYMETPTGRIPITALMKKNTYETGTNVINMLRDAQLLMPGDRHPTAEFQFTGTMPENFEKTLHRTLLLDLAMANGDEPESVTGLFMGLKYLEGLGLITEKMNETLKKVYPLSLDGHRGPYRKPKNPDEVELTSEEEKQLNIQKQRFHDPNHMEMHKHIAWKDVERAIRTYPEILWQLAQMEQAGGEPDLIDENCDEFIFGDCVKECPEAHNNAFYDLGELDRAHAENKFTDNNHCAQITADGINAELMAPKQYEILIQALPVEGVTMLQTPDLIRQFENRSVTIGVEDRILYFCDEAPRIARGYRLAVRLTKAKQ